MMMRQRETAQPVGGLARACLLLPLLLCCVRPCAAQPERITAYGGEYDLQRCIDTALRHNPALRASAAAIAAARAELTRADGAADPKLTAMGGVSVYQSDPAFAVPGLGQLVFGQRTNADAALQLDWPFYTSGQTDAAKDQARAAIKAATFAELRSRQQVALGAVTAYFGVLQAQGGLEVSKSRLESLQGQDHAVSMMQEVGLVPRLDALRTRAALAAAEEGMTVAETGLQVAAAGLIAALGVPADTEISVVDRFEDVELPESLAEAFDEALSQRPDLHEALAQIEAAEAAYRLASHGRRPVFGLYARADFLRTTLRPQTGALSGGLNFRWPIFDGDAAEAGKDKADAQRQGLEAYRDQLRDQIEFQVAEAFLKFKAAPQRIETATRGVEAADAGFEAAAVGYANQAVPLTDMLDAQAARAQAQNDLVSATYDHRLAMAHYVHALGR
jgi:outer membrane protein